MSDENAEKAPGALVLLSQAIDLAQAANDDCKRLSALLAASKAEVAAERTRADEAEAVMQAIVNATSGTGAEPTGKEMLAGVTDALTMPAVERARQHTRNMEAEVARLREVIERVRVWNSDRTGIRDALDDILDAVPVEPQTPDHENGGRS